MISAVNNKIYKLAHKYFENSTISLNNNIFEIQNNGTCLNFEVNIDDNELFVGILELNKCKFSGSENLNKLEHLLTHINIKFIILEDQSYLNYLEYRIDLATLLILSKGQSWYNSLDYKQENFSNEYNTWQQIRYLTFIDLNFDDINFNIITENKNWYDIPLYFIAYIHDYENIDKNNFKEIIKMSIDFVVENCGHIIYDRINLASYEVYQNIKNNIYQSEDNFLPYYLYIYLCSAFIKYTRFPLIKKLR